jgi:hypothetical protein
MDGIEVFAKNLKKEMTNVESFLDFLRMISSFYFRRKIKLTDVEINDNIRAGKESIVSIVREYYFMKRFLQDPKRAKKYKAFRSEVGDAVDNVLNPKLKESSPIEPQVKTTGVINKN